MIDRLRNISFIEQLNNPEFFRNLFKEIVNEFANSNGGVKLFWDETALKAAFNEWRTSVAAWLLQFQADMFSASVQDTDSLQLSHIKSMGALLESLTQIGHEPVLAAKIEGILPEHLASLLKAYPNEFYCFIGCFLIFNFQQHERHIEARYDLENPPMHFRYLRSMVAYLRPKSASGQARDETDFYMIFKTMDLYGLKENYANR